MRFFARDDEIAELRRIREKSHEFSKMTVVTGRRRVGKTELIKHALNDGTDKFVYLLITKQEEKPLCEGLQQEAVKALGRPIPGVATKFSDLFRAIVEYSTEEPITLVIDEFQEFDKINSGVFGEVAGIWDEYHNRTKLNLVICGSVNRLMNKVFFSYGEPLYGRNTGRLHLEPFKVSVLKEIFASFKPDYSNDDLLALWTLTGGVARYVALLMENGAFTRKAMERTVFGEITSFIDEGRIILAEEFGNDYMTYFSILSAIASGATTFGEITNAVGTDVGTYLANLEKNYGLVVRKVPLFDKEKSRNSTYSIDDCFFRFWFRFVFKCQHLIELRRFEELRGLFERDYEVFSGFALELYFRRKIIEDSRCTRIGGWWDRKGENEIDLVIEDEFANTLDFREIKRDGARISLGDLRAKAEAFFAKHPELKNRNASFAGLSMGEM